MMEQGPTEKKIFQDHVKYGTPLPQALQNVPYLNYGSDIYYTAFIHLSTCRVSNMSLGNISYFMCVQYCDINNIQHDQREDFIEVMLAVDEWYVDYLNEKSKKKADKRKKKVEVEKDED